MFNLMFEFNGLKKFIQKSRIVNIVDPIFNSFLDVHIYKDNQPQGQLL